MRGGKRQGAGRKKGTPNKATAERRALAEKSGEMPEAFLLRVSRGGKIDGHTITFEQRLQAAKDAAPYFAPKLASVEHGGADAGPIIIYMDSIDAAM